MAHFAKGLQEAQIMTGCRKTANLPTADFFRAAFFIHRIASPKGHSGEFSDMII